MKIKIIPKNERQISKAEMMKQFEFVHDLVTNIQHPEILVRKNNPNDGVFDHEKTGTNPNSIRAVYNVTGSGTSKLLGAIKLFAPDVIITI